ncbi:hypothetical protein [Xenorhabdus thailandensis]|uniref:hypothetical protein n=1 Tax=Xenorhabdus thailandensis TaxID=3136255 RepID=UPI0030F42099
MAINQIAKIGLSSLQVIYYFESLFIASERVAIGAGYEFESICKGRLINNDGTFSDQLSYVKLNPNIIRNTINVKE